MRTARLLSVICVVILQCTLLAFAESPCNEYVDGILTDLKNTKEEFQDPYEIPEKSIEVSKKVLLVNYTGEAKIYDGHVFGLSTLHRDGDVVVDHNKKTHLKVWLGAGELDLKCSGKVKLMGHGPTATIDAKIVFVSMKLDIVPTTTGSNPKINNFSIEDVKGLEVKTSGLGPLNFFADRYVRFIGRAFKGLVKNAIETRLKTFMSKKLKDYTIPDECINQ